MKKIGLFSLFCFLILQLPAQQKPGKRKETQPLATVATSGDADTAYKALRWRNIGPYRGGRSVAVSGVVTDPLVYYMGTTGGGVWKTNDAGGSWRNISDGYFTTGSIGAIAVSESDPNVVFVGAGEHAPRGVMTSYGDGVYKSTDAGKTWRKMGLELTRHIAAIRIHPDNPDVVYVAAQGALHGATQERGIYKSTDGGTTWKKILYVDENTGCNDLSMDHNNPRILYASMWDYRRLPWQVRSGGKGSNLYKSTDAGETWVKMTKGLPAEKGKMAIAVSPANSEKVYALIEGDTEKEQGGLFVSNDAGKNWSRISKDHRLVQRAWYYIEIAVDPNNENVVYVFNSPALRSADGGRTWTNIRGTHGDYHQLWINPRNSANMVIANDGGAAISFNTGKTWSTQTNQPTAQFYRVNVDNRFPYYVYGGQQDNTSVMIASRNLAGYNIGERNWWPSAGGESAFLAFDPKNPRYVMGGSYQGTIEVFDQELKESKGVMVAPVQYQSLQPKDMKYRFNWNAPIVYSMHDSGVFYHAGNILFRTRDLGNHWEAMSPDLTRHDTAKMGQSGVPYTNEGAGGENYATIAYVAESPHEKGVIWTGSDDGLVYLTRDNGKTWSNVTPAGLSERLINCIEVSPHDKGTAYIATTRYKFNDFTPALFKTTDYGKTWTNISAGIPYGAYTRCVREDDVQKDLLYAGTETGFYVSYNGGRSWRQQQLNLPITPITDLKVHDGNLIASTMGRSFWILDDLAVLRQYDRRDTVNTFALLKPSAAYRISGGSALDAIDEEDTSPLPTGVAGANPTSGVSLYYTLPSGNDSAKLTLEILDQKGQLVRRYSSEADPKFAKFPGGPEEDQALPRKTGLNRFVWDLRYATLPGVDNVFIEGSYQGRKVSPGTFTAKLKRNNEERTATITVLPDPRLHYTASDYAAQQQILAEIDGKIKEMHDDVNRLRAVRRQVTDLAALLTDTVANKAILEKGRKLSKDITAWEEKLVQPKAQSNDDIINFVNKLSADYIFLKGELDNNIPTVTNGETQRLAELNAEWQPLKNEFAALQQQVAEFNAMYRNANLGKIIIPAE